MSLLLAFLLVTGPVEPPAPPTVSFVFDRPQLTVVHYEIVVGEDGKGVYRAETKDGIKLESPIALNDAAGKRVWAEAKATGGFKINCETKLKNLAQTGKKELIWTGKEGSGSCIYNYSDDKEIQAVTAIFQSLAQTMEYGQQLEHAHRFDRLGLDGIMTSLTQSIKEGRATDVQNIAPVLQKIAGDLALLDRVRAKAEMLLEKP